MPVDMACMPMAPRVPMAVDTTVAITATSRVVLSAPKMVGSWNSCTYQSKVKPVHWLRDTEALKDSAIITAMGAYRKISTSAIQTARMILTLL